MKKLVGVTQYVTVEINEAKFTEAFLREFRKDFYPYETIDQHVEHLALAYVRGAGDFVEGYGPREDMGIVFGECGTAVQILDEDE